MTPAKLRISTGLLKGRAVQAHSQHHCRPITSLNRQRIFNKLGQTVAGARFLDLFAGTGVMGFEALSRGADSAVFLDESPEAIFQIGKNAQALGVADRCRPLLHRLERLDRLPLSPRAFDIIFLAPPYALFPLNALEGLKTHLSPGSLLIYEYSSRHRVEEVAGLESVEVFGQGDTRFSLFINSQTL